jgi:hypothetical protein
MSTLNTLPYANLQATDAVTGKFMFTDCADKDAFYRLRVSKPSTLFEGSTIYDSNTVYFDDDIRGSASITGPNTSAAMTLTVTGSTVNDYAARQSHFYAHYQPGKSFLSMFSFSFGPAVAGITKRVGMYDVDNANTNNPLNGVLLEQTTSGLTWYLYKGDGTFQSAAQVAWNVDPLNGSGPSGFNLTTLKAEQNLLGFVDLEWLGVGRVRVGLFINGVPIICNVFNNNGFSVPYLNNPTLPIRYEVRRTSGNLTGSFNAICCSIMSEGGFESIGVIHSIQSPTLSVNSGAIRSILAIRLKSSNPRASLFPVSTEIASNIGGNATAYFRIYLWRPSSAAAVPAAGWTDVSATLGGSGSFAEYNTSTTLYTTMDNDVTVNAARCIQIDEGSISSVSKNTFQYISRSLNFAQSSVDKSNRDVIVIAINNPTPNSRNFTALFTWREI